MTRASFTVPAREGVLREGEVREPANYGVYCFYSLFDCFVNDSDHLHAREAVNMARVGRCWTRSCWFVGRTHGGGSQLFGAAPRRLCPRRSACAPAACWLCAGAAVCRCSGWPALPRAHCGTPSDAHGARHMRPIQNSVPTGAGASAGVALRRSSMMQFRVLPSRVFFLW